MRPILNDLRLLKLAELYEIAYESFILDVATRMIAQEDVRRKLLQLQAPSQRQHDRIVALMEDLNARLRDEDRAEVERAAVLDALETEQAAADFYHRHAEEVHDPEVRALFREMAREEDQHVKLVKEALRMLGESPPDEAHEGALRLTDPPLWEGVSDLVRRAGGG